MSSRKIEKVLSPPAPNMVGDGFRVHNFFPSGYGNQQRLSPFYLMDYNSAIEFPPTESPRGVGVHPHRGFETVTIAFQGAVAHHDSAGNSGVIYPGDVQWMTAGSGVLHKEYHEKEFAKKGGPFQMVQLWVNLPADKKMTEPKYQAVTSSDQGKAQLDGGAEIRVIAGNFMDTKGPAKTHTPIQMFVVDVPKDASIQIPTETSFNTGILVVSGEVQVNDQMASTDQFVLFENEGSLINIEGLKDAQLLFLSGEPIDEPIVQYGPFLMNTYEEIQQAFRDVHNGKFGYLED